MATPAIITVISRAMEKAARSLKRDFYEVENLQISVKGPRDFVSAADKRAEEILHAELSRDKPNAGFLMEEGGEIKGKDNSKFIIDPLDGTTNFLHGIPHWSISVGYEVDGVMQAGAILDPIKDEMFYATKGGGAWMRGNKRLRVSNRKDLSMCVVASSQLCYQQPQSKQIQQQCTTRSNGGSALDLAYVAAGRLDAYYEGISQQKWPAPWDLAAGALIVQEAGGMVSEIDGRTNHIYNKNILAANEQIYAQLKDILNKK